MYLQDLLYIEQTISSNYIFSEGRIRCAKKEVSEERNQLKCYSYIVQVLIGSKYLQCGSPLVEGKFVKNGKSDQSEVLRVLLGSFKHF